MTEHAPALEAKPESPAPAAALTLPLPAVPADSVRPEHAADDAGAEGSSHSARSRRHTSARRRKREDAVRQATREKPTATDSDAEASPDPELREPAQADDADGAPEISGRAPRSSPPATPPLAARASIRATIDVFGHPAPFPPDAPFDLILAEPAGGGTSPAYETGEWLPASLEALEGRLQAVGEGRVAIVVDGNPLEVGPGCALLSALGPAQVRLHATAGGLQRALGRIGFSPEDVTPLRIARLGQDGVLARLRRGRLYAIDPAPLSPQDMGRLLEEAGLHQARVWIASPSMDVPVTAMLAFELSDSALPFAADAFVVAYTVGADGRCREWPGIPATELPGALPEAARLLALAWLQPGSEECGWCIEGSRPALALDWARERPDAEVHCIGCDDDALSEAAARHQAGDGLRAVPGGSFHSLEGLPDPNVAFVRAGEEFTQQIRTAWSRLRPGGRMVAVAEDEGARLELMQFAHRTRPALWQDLSVANGDPEARSFCLAPASAVRLMGWTKPPRG
ncbi:MAG: hypothetical protein KDG55_14215 [Rhodocyclaceae bacterium]|nr:hypothetical protein [Rhodocyclaceae bacterium]